LRTNFEGKNFGNSVKKRWSEDLLKGRVYQNLLDSKEFQGAWAQKIKRMTQEKPFLSHPL
jgi:hypothetical protein